MKRIVAAVMAALFLLSVLVLFAHAANRQADSVDTSYEERGVDVEILSITKSVEGDNLSQKVEWLYDVPLDKDLQAHIIRACEEKRIDPAVVLAMAYRERGFDAEAIGDGGDAYGLLQVQPKWHYDRMQALGCTDLLDPYQNVTVAVDYLAEQLDRFDGDIGKALVGYNQYTYYGTLTDYALAVLAMAEELRGEYDA